MELRAILVLLAGDPDARREEEIAHARRELEAALETLRLARATWSNPQSVDVEAVRRALDAAERQLDAARVRLRRALQDDPGTE